MTRPPVAWPGEEDTMTPAPAWIFRIVLGIALAPGVSAAVPSPLAAAQDGDAAGAARAPEFDGVRKLIAELKLDEAKEAMEAAVKGLGDRKRDKGVKAEKKIVDDNLDALEEFLDARKKIEDGDAGRALKPLMKVMRTPGALYFQEEAEKVYEEIKGKAYYMVNDWETKHGRRKAAVQTNAARATAEVVEDLRLSQEGRHSLRVTFVARQEGVKETEGAAWRSVLIKGPDGLAEELPRLKSISLGIFSPSKQNVKLDLGITGGKSSSFAQYEGIMLNYAGWKTFTIPLAKMKLTDDFQWAEGKSIFLKTTGPDAAEFYVDDVKLLR